MDSKLSLKTLSPWPVITIVGCILLSLIDVWREEAVTSVPLVRGTLPNFLAVPILTFGFLMIRFPSRVPFDSSVLKVQAKWFWTLWIATICITLAWEFLQLTGALVFDVNDLFATFAGAIVAAGLYGSLKYRSFLPAETS